MATENLRMNYQIEGFAENFNGVVMQGNFVLTLANLILTLNS